MTTQRLLAHWIAGLAVVAVLTWLSTATGARQFEAIRTSYASREVAALRRDSVMAVEAARKAGIARGDSVAAAVFVPPEPGLGPLSERQPSGSRVLLIIVGIALLLFQSTAKWRRERGKHAT